MGIFGMWVGIGGCKRALAYCLMRVLHRLLPSGAAVVPGMHLHVV